MDCLNGYFQDVYTTSMAETLLLSGTGGAVAVWASSGLNQPEPQAQMDRTIIQSLFTQPVPTLGDAIAFAILILILLIRPSGLLGKKDIEKV